MSDQRDDRLLEPGEAYRNGYQKEFRENAETLFGDLVKRSGINVGENRKTAEEYRQKEAEADKAERRLSRFRGLRVLFIILAVACAIASIVGFVQSIWLLGILALVGIAAPLLPLFLWLNPFIRTLRDAAGNLAGEAAELLAKARAQIAPLLSLFDGGMTADLVTQTVPLLKLDRNFHMARYDYLHGKYQYAEQEDDDSSTVGILSGEILGNPFVVERTLHHRLGNQTYRGSLTIHWVTYTRDSNGRRVAQHHTQVLHAYVTKPKPFYSTSTRLVYGNDAAPDLRFTHEKTHAETMSERQRKSYVESGIKKIRKQAEKRVADGFTEMGNEEFDVLFGATDRDNEVQFRLLFTALGQKNELDLIKGGSPYGDDFRFRKQNCLNVIVSEHAQKWDFDVDTGVYASYDVDLCKAKFLSYNEDYFRNLYFDLAPLLAIPLYQQYKPREYIYKENYRRNYTAREAEVLANRFAISSFAHPYTRTKVILKTALQSKTEDTDRVTVTAYSYRAIRRVEIIPVLGGDGHMHPVPVPWVEYIPVTRDTTMQIRALDADAPAYRRSREAEISDPHVCFHRLFAVVSEADLPPKNAKDDRPEEERDLGEIDETQAEISFGDDAEVWTDSE